MKTITKAPILMRGGDYNPDQWLDRPDILEKDIEMMKKAGMNTATLGVFAWAKYEPREGEYDFTWPSWPPPAAPNRTGWPASTRRFCACRPTV